MIVCVLTFNSILNVHTLQIIDILAYLIGGEGKSIPVEQWNPNAQKVQIKKFNLRYLFVKQIFEQKLFT